MTNDYEVSAEEFNRQAATSAIYDQAIELDRKRMEREREDPRLLILGSGDSGKTTLLKQLRIFYGQAFTAKEIENYRKLLLLNLVTSMQKLVALARQPEFGLAESAHERLIAEFPVDGMTSVPAAVTDAIVALWNAEAVQKALLVSSRYNIQDTAGVFLSRAREICDPAFVPTNKDILMVRSPTLCVTETAFKIGIHNYHFYDVGGQRGLRKQWAPFFDYCHGILFVASLSSFDQTLSESEEPINRMTDAIELFGQVVNNKVLAKSDIMLFLNKRDLFEAKLERVRFADYFEKYMGANDPDNVAKYIAALFKAQNRDPERKFLLHRTCCIDQVSMEVIVSRMIETLTITALNSIGAL
eukprot:jgi/Hompol1/5042/HPOL_000733-RA